MKTKTCESRDYGNLIQLTGRWFTTPEGWQIPCDIILVTVDRPRIPRDMRRPVAVK